MLDHRLESLEARSLLSTVTMHDGMPGVDAAGSAAVIEEAAWADDSDMYSFRRGAGDDAVYEDAAAWEDGGTDDYGWDGGVLDHGTAADVVEETWVEDGESHPWIGLGDSTDEPETVAADEADVDETDAMADAVSFAHEDEGGTVWIGDGEDEAGDETDGALAADLPDADVRFSFDAGTDMPSYRDLAL